MEWIPYIKSVVESLRCPLHKEHPEILINEEEHIRITCCCADFRKECLYLVEKLVRLTPKR
jgi:hypothetical protein